MTSPDPAPAPVTGQCPIAGLPPGVSPKAQRGAAYFAKVAAFCVGGAVVGGLFLAWAGGDLRHDVYRVSAAAAAAFHVEAPGKFVLYHEYETVVDGRLVRRPPALPEMTWRLVAAGDSRPLTISAPRKLSRYSLGRRRGVAVGELDFPRAGDYTFTATAADAGSGAPPVVFVIARDLPRRIWLSSLGSFVIFLAFGMAALAMVGTTVKHRVIARRVAARTAALAADRGLPDPSADPSAPPVLRRAHPLTRD